ncbi:MAG: hypothetical protein U5J63_05065 [Fodinibius sp.]|nr:hypothetical protein [Fodinibius sp.]
MNGFGSIIWATSRYFWTIKTTQALLLLGSLIIALLYVIPNMRMLGKQFGTMSFGQSPLAQLNIAKYQHKKIKNAFYGIGSRH